MLVYYTVGLAGWLIIWPFIPGLVGFTTTIFLAWWPTACILSFRGEAFANNMAMLISQIEAFEISEAQVQEDSDRQMILRHIDQMFPEGGDKEFDSLVRTDVKRVVIEEFSLQRAPISYRIAMIANYATAV